MSDTTHLLSTAHLSSTFGIAYAIVQEAIVELGLKPELTLDGIAYYSGADHDHLWCHLGNKGVIEFPTIHVPVGRVEFEQDEALEDES